VEPFSRQVRAALLILALAMFSMATASLAILGIGAAITRSFGMAFWQQPCGDLR